MRINVTWVEMLVLLIDWPGRRTTNILDIGEFLGRDTYIFSLDYRWLGERRARQQYARRRAAAPARKAFLGPRDDIMPMYQRRHFLGRAMRLASKAFPHRRHRLRSPYIS